MKYLSENRPLSKKKKRLLRQANRRGNWYVKPVSRGLALAACGMKKMRGWRAKRFFTVKISQITEEGFWIHNEGRDFYVCRKQYPWFLTATDKEIRDVDKIYDGTEDGSSNGFYWNTLDFGLVMKYFYHPETLKVYNVYVRGEQREDLYEQHVQWLIENNLPVPERRVLRKGIEVIAQ